MAENVKKQPLLVRFLEKLGNIFLLNALWILFSIPIITIGASTTALYSVCLKMTDDVEDSIFKGFKKAFVENFKQATVCWLCILAAAGIIYGELALGAFVGGAIVVFYKIVAIIEIALLLMIMAYLFPLISRYENKWYNQIKNALLLAVSNLGATIKILVAWVMPIYLTTFPAILIIIWYVWILFLVGTIAYGTSFTLRRVFKRIDERMNDEGGEETVKKEAVRKETPAPAKRNIAAIAGRKLSNIEEEKKEE